MQYSQRTLVILKPEVLERNIMGEVLQYFDREGFKTIRMQQKRALSHMMRTHYSSVIKKVSEDVGRDIVSRMTRGDCVFIVYEGDNVIQRVRAIIGSTDPTSAEEGTIRKKYGKSIQYNVIHGSDSLESAKQEIELWFPELTESAKSDLINDLHRGC